MINFKINFFICIVYFINMKSIILNHKVCDFRIFKYLVFLLIEKKFKKHQEKTQKQNIYLFSI